MVAAVPSDEDFATNGDSIDDAFAEDEVDPVGAALSGFEEEINSEPPSITPEEIEVPSSSSSYPLVADYQPCGGISEHPCALDEACAECANEDFTCERSNAYYYQCKPPEEEDTRQEGGGGRRSEGLREMCILNFLLVSASFASIDSVIHKASWAGMIRKKASKAQL